MLECLADKDLQDWLGLDSEVKETLLDIVELNSLVVSFFIGNILSGWWLVNIIIARHCSLIDHVVVILERDPVVLLVSLRHGALELLLLLVQRGAIVDIACVDSLLLSLLHELLLHPLLL
jgi:hypothetical protein